MTQTTPNTNPPNAAASLSAWDPYVGYFQLSRFKFVDADGTNPRAPRPRLRAADPARLQQPPGVLPRRGRHRLRQAQQPVDDDGRRHAGGRHRRQRLRPVRGPAARRAADRPRDQRDRRHLHADLQRPDDRADPLQRDARPDRRGARGALRTSAPTTSRPAAARSTRPTSTSSSGARCSSPTRPRSRANGAALTGTTPTVATTTAQEGGWYQRPTGDDRRSTLNSNDLRGKLLRIHVKDDIAAADHNKADLGAGRRVHDPVRQPVPAGGRRPAGARPVRRSTRWASATRSACRWTRTTSPT